MVLGATSQVYLNNWTASLASKYKHIQEETERLITKEGRIGLCLNAPKLQSVTNEYSKGGQD